MGADGGQSADTALVAYLLEHQATARWIVAVNGSNSAAAIQLAAGRPVMSMGGFTGSDPTPTLDQLRAYVASGELRYVLVGGGGFGPGPGGRGASTEVSTWVTANCTAVSVGGSSTTGLYDCASTATP